MQNNKRGWINMVEAMVAILLIAGVVLLAIQQSQGIADDPYTRIHNDQINILRDIQLNGSLREDVVNPAITPPVEWNSANFPVDLRNRIVNKTPSYINCSAKICETGDSCILLGSEEDNLYAEFVIIAATPNNYNPRQLKLFCWEKS